MQSIGTIADLLRVYIDGCSTVNQRGRQY